MSYIETDLNGINSLVGGLPIGSQTALFGAPKSGKTILTHQFAHETIKHRGGNALIIDTEGSGVTHREWVETFNERYDHDVELIEGEPTGGEMDVSLPSIEGDENLVVYTLPDLGRILRLHGRPIRFEHTGSKLNAKTEDGFMLNPWDSPIGKWCQQNDVKYLAYDSATMPAEVFGTAGQNLPARHAGLMNWLQAAALLTQFLRLTTVTTLHQSVSPQVQFERVSFSGGKAVEHNHKYFLYMNHKSNNDAHTPSPPVKFRRENDHGRYIWMARHPSRPDWSRCVLLNLTNEGFVDYER